MSNNITTAALRGAFLRVAVIAGAALLTTSMPARAAWVPEKPVEFMVPAGTGGGADQMARLIQGIVAKHNLMKQPMVVVNKGGGAGAEGFLDVKGAKGDPHKIVITLSNLFTTPLATGVPFNWRDLTPVAMMALDQFVLWVNADTPYKTAKEYVDAVKAAGPLKIQDGRHGLQAGGPDPHRRASKRPPAPSSSTCRSRAAARSRRSWSASTSTHRQQPDRGGGAVARRPAAAAVRVRRQAHAVQGGRSPTGKSWNDIPTCKEAGVPDRLPDAARHLHARRRDARAGGLLRRPAAEGARDAGMEKVHGSSARSTRRS